MSSDRAPSRQMLIDHLLETRIAGAVATSRENNLDHYRELAAGNRYYWLGLELDRRWADEGAVLELMSERCGVIADPAHRSGQDTIDPELTVDALDRAAVALRKAATGGYRVLLATGHPGGMLGVHQATAAALRAAGCEVMTIAPGLYGDDGRLLQIGGVAMVLRGAALVHSHSPAPMTAVLDAMERDGRPLPQLVVADHGWAGCAAQRGIPAIGYADCNDPALFCGEADGTLSVAIPLDDHVYPEYYDPMTAYLLTRAGLARG